MENVDKRRHYERGSLAFEGRHNGGFIGLDAAGERPPCAHRMGLKMKIFLITINLSVFFYGMFSGAGLHTAIESSSKQNPPAIGEPYVEKN